MTDGMQAAWDDVIVEMELCVNQRLYANGYITAEMYEKAKTIILKRGGGPSGQSHRQPKAEAGLQKFCLK